ncbi:MAG TPA: hypothetical protein VJZ76_11185 [Thermoanaerobaculia bacterium]|nr:hypothetical protein [Thermoanaerobaculia bacterium]
MLLLFAAATASAHPGSSIAVSKTGAVYFVDTGAGVFAIDANGRMEKREGPAFHFFAFDPESRFRNTPWPYIPGAEFRAVGGVVLSSDFPVTVGRDGRFYYPDGTDRKQIRMVGIDPTGARSVLATLPPVHRGSETVTWINGLAAGPDGSLYYTEDQAIRKIDPRGRVTTVAEIVSVPKCGRIPGLADYTAPYLRGLAVADDGTIYVAASACGALLRVDRAGRVTPVLWTSPPWSPTAVAVHGRDLYVLEYLHTAEENRREWIPRVRKVTSDGKMSIVSGNTRK